MAYLTIAYFGLSELSGLLTGWSCKLQLDAAYYVSVFKSSNLF